MRLGRPFALLRTTDQWLRAAHEGTYVEPKQGVVQLDWVDAVREPSVQETVLSGRGLAFDRSCRLYRSRGDAGQIELFLWGDPSARRAGDALPLFEETELPRVGDFEPTPSAGLALNDPRGIAIDDDDRLFVAERGNNQVRVVDLWSRRVLRVERFAAPHAPGPAPVDVVSSGSEVWVLTQEPAALYSMTARRAARRQSLPAEVVAPSRLACSKNRLLILDRAGTGDARVHRVRPAAPAIAAPFATDIELESEDVLVIAFAPDQDLQRIHLVTGSELSPHRARGYDGRGIVRAPDGTIGFFGTHGAFTQAVPARLNYRKRGRVISHRLDSGEFQTKWGRLFIDACIPEGTSVRVAFASLDDVDEDDVEVARTRPARSGSASVPHSEQSPPMPPARLLPTAEQYGPLHRRETGRELPWVRAEVGDTFVTYEAPIIAAPGRWLWVFLELSGTSRLSPRVAALRAEYPVHDYLRRLPRLYSRDEAAADFLSRYLAMFDGFLFELEAKAAAREILLDPHVTPEEALPWLASFSGLLLDERWPLAAKRQMVAKASALFRLRGTRWSLEEMIAIATGTRPILIEHFRLRGLGGAIVGEADGALTSAVLGAGYRVGAAIGTPGSTQLPTDAGAAVGDPFERTAHRFSVVIPARLSSDELDVVRFILDRHRPAHTIYDLCLVDAGMRVGLGLHLGLSSLIGRTGGFDRLTLGQNLLGRSLLGRAEPGISIGNEVLGLGSRVG